MNYFNIDFKKLLFLALFVGLPIFLAINMAIYTGPPPWYLRPFTFTSSLIQKAFTNFSLEIRGTTGLYLNLISVKRENNELRAKNQKFHAQLAAVTELKLENQRLSQLLDFKQKSELELLAAKIIGKDLLATHNTLTLDKGTADGIKAGMAVITHAGAVGYILEPEIFTSKVLLLIDRYAAIYAIVQRSRARGIIEGKDGDLCALKYLKRDDDILVGDLVVTSGLDNIFPKGFPIGQVKKFSKAQFGMTQDVEVEPVVNPFSLEEVFVITNTHQTQQYDQNQGPKQKNPDKTLEKKSVPPNGNPSASKKKVFHNEPSNSLGLSHSLPPLFSLQPLPEGFSE